MTPERANRVADFIRSELADIVQNQMRDPRVSLLSITDARVSRDLGVADVYVTSLAAGDVRQRTELIEVLNGAAGFLRSALAGRHAMRTTPRLRFHYDELIEGGPRLEALIDRAVEGDGEVHADGPVACDGRRRLVLRGRTLARRSRGRDVSGVIVLDKPQGMSSSDAVQRVKRLFAARKVGHTGSLDPLATGVLPLCLGDATKFSQYLLNSDKRYVAHVRLGISTNSGDADGEILEEREVTGIDRARLESALDAFRGEIEQVPSMFSAVKHHGKPLYKLARLGIEIEREARPVTVYSNEIVAFEGTGVTLEIHCSKGTYVRTIAHDLGEALGCGAHVDGLRRTQAGPTARTIWRRSKTSRRRAANTGSMTCCAR